MNTNTNRAAELRTQAAAERAAAEESFQRCDTDGFLTQWAHGLTAHQLQLQATIEENGGTSEFVGLFDRETGLRIKAKVVSVYNRFSYSHESRWCVLDAADKAIAWFPTGARSRNQKKAGLFEKMELAPAKAVIRGSGTGLSGNAWAAISRTDDGYPEDAVVWTDLGDDDAEPEGMGSFR